MAMPPLHILCPGRKVVNYYYCIFTVNDDAKTLNSFITPKAAKS